MGEILVTGRSLHGQVFPFEASPVRSLRRAAPDGVVVEWGVGDRAESRRKKGTGNGGVPQLDPSSSPLS